MMLHAAVRRKHESSSCCSWSWGRRGVIPRLLTLVIAGVMMSTGFPSVEADEQNLYHLRSKLPSWAKAHRPRQRRSLKDLEQDVFETLLKLHENGPMDALRVPQVARKVHRILIEGSADEGEELDDRARKLAGSALSSAADRVYASVNFTRAEIKGALRSSQSSRELGPPAALIAVVVVFLLVTIVSLIVGAVTGEEWPFLTVDSDFINGNAIGASFKNILPCDTLPLVQTEKYGYFPLTSALTSSLSGFGSDLLSFFEGIFDTSEDNYIANHQASGEIPDTCYPKDADCSFSGECCKSQDAVVGCNGEGKCEHVPTTALQSASTSGGTALELFCILWSKKENTTTIDTLAFAPLSPWPAIPVVAPCKYGEIKRFTISGYPVVATMQFRGIAFSWADESKLAFGTNDVTSDLTIWDGFRNVDLPEIPDINFWLSLRFSINDAAVYDLRKSVCEASQSTTGVISYLGYLAKSTAASQLLSALLLRLDMDFELYIGFDKQTDYGEDEAEELAGGLMGGSTRDLSENLWRDLQGNSEDPCVIITMTSLIIGMPLLAIVEFGRAIGGFCNVSPEDTGVRCAPSGFFLTIEQKFEFTGGLLGILGSILLSGAGEIGINPATSTNAIGVFQDAQGNNEAVILRLEMPAQSLFGIGIPRPSIHFQHIKGSEVEMK